MQDLLHKVVWAIASLQASAASPGPTGALNPLLSKCVEVRSIWGRATDAGILLAIQLLTFLGLNGYTFSNFCIFFSKIELRDLEIRVPEVKIFLGTNSGANLTKLLWLRDHLLSRVGDRPTATILHAQFHIFFLLSFALVFKAKCWAEICPS